MERTFLLNGLTAAKVTSEPIDPRENPPGGTAILGPAPSLSPTVVAIIHAEANRSNASSRSTDQTLIQFSTITITVFTRVTCDGSSTGVQAR